MPAEVDVHHNAKRFVYVLRSMSDPERQFVESTANVPMRVAAHNAGHSPHTANHRPWKVAAVLQFASEASALRFEKYLKSNAGRAFMKVYLS